MKAPRKIHLGVTDGKNYSVVKEGYPFAKEYINKESAIRKLRELRSRCGGDVAWGVKYAIYEIESM